MGFDKPSSKAMERFLAKEKSRLVGLSIEEDSGEVAVFIYTRSHEWCDDNGAGSFVGRHREKKAAEGNAIRRFYERIEKGNGDRNYPQPARLSNRVPE